MERTIENIKILVGEGRSIREISEVFGVSQSAMAAWMRRRGIKPAFGKHGEGRGTFTNGIRRWSDDDLINAVQGNSTIADVIRSLELTVRPGNYRTVKRHIARLGLDVSHFTGKSHSRRTTKMKRLEEVMVDGSTYATHALKKRIIECGLIPYECEQCGMGPRWNGKKMVLVLDHINGNNCDARKENLRFLCPNCNSQQDTFCRKRTGSSVGRAEG
jgi:Zn finger protein HypA/HybF involved in hydrogenase expression